MKQKLFVTMSILIILTFSACGGSAEPTVSPQDQAATAVAEAWLVITQTQAALPTSTPIPPTNTPAPTFTFIPTLAPIATIAVGSTPTQQSECDQIPVAEPKGTLVSVEFYNESQGSANFAFGMNSPNDNGECFTYSFIIGNNDVVPAKVLAGCYWGYAWITSGQETSVARSADVLMCMKDTAVIYKVKITKETVNFR